MNSGYTKILESLDIVDVVASYISLKRAGSNYKALCPFHQEDTPSLMVSPQKQIYKCFGCGNSGNFISFVRDYEKISYYEAAKKISEKYHLQISFGKVKKNSHNELLYKINLLAREFFCQNLTKYQSSAWNFLKERNLSEATIKTFEIGYALNSQRALFSYLTKNSINSKALENSGLFRASGGSFNDIFIDRVIFPIESIGGRVVAFGGRTLTGASAKYINSPTTPIYTKGEHLYGLQKTKYEISRVDKVIITEGYLDFLKLYDRGYRYAVAALGTSFTKSQLRLLSRYTKNFYLLFDGDDAGIEASAKAAGQIVELGYSVQIIRLPSKEDPDSFFDNNSEEDFQGLLKTSLALPEFVKRYKKDRVETKISQMVDVAKGIKSNIAKELFLHRVAEVFNISFRSLFSQAQFQKRVYKQKDEVFNDVLESFLTDEILFFTSMFDQIPNYKQEIIAFDASCFESIGSRDFFIFVKKAIQQGASCFNDLVVASELADSTFAKVLTSIKMRVLPEVDFYMAQRNLLLRKMTKEIDVLNRQILEGEKMSDLIDKKQELKKNIANLGGKTVAKILF